MSPPLLPLLPMLPCSQLDRPPPSSCFLSIRAQVRSLEDRLAKQARQIAHYQKNHANTKQGASVSRKDAVNPAGATNSSVYNFVSALLPPPAPLSPSLSPPLSPMNARCPTWMSNFVSAFSRQRSARVPPSSILVRVSYAFIDHIPGWCLCDEYAGAERRGEIIDPE